MRELDEACVDPFFERDSMNERAHEVCLSTAWGAMEEESFITRQEAVGVAKQVEVNAAHVGGRALEVLEGFFAIVCRDV